MSTIIKIKDRDIMKNYLILILLCGASIIFIPLIMINRSDISPVASTTTAQPTQESISAEATDDTISVFRTVSNKAEEVSVFEYVCGSVAAEMPLAYNEEAIKAQAVACYTNALRQKQTSNGEKGDISDDTATHQGYIDEAQRKEKWGDDFEKYEKKLQSAVKAVENEALYYNGQLCVAAFCAISNGNTENAESLWGTKVPYLVSVKSEGDSLSPTYASTVSFSEYEFNKIIKSLQLSADSTVSLEDTIKITGKSKAGTVLTVELYGKSFTGEQIRKAFSLRSPTFTVKATKKAVTFSVSGYGHGIGMSQYGANYYAEKGWDYKKILEHYYTGVEIVKK